MLFVVTNAGRADEEGPNFRRPSNDAELKYWLENMIIYHGFDHDEVQTATGLTHDEIDAAIKQLDIDTELEIPNEDDAPLLCLPFPGGRHPRIGFLEGAIRPQRESKISVFTPWKRHDYVVVDVPEAIWSNLGLTYLAHTHVPTVWTRQNVELERLEWNRRDDGTFDIRRTLPNGIEFSAKIQPTPHAVHMDLWLYNGTSEMLTDLRVQNCVMLKSAEGFNEQTKENKVSRQPYTACRSDDGRRWVITAWEPNHRAWANERCPCLHSDPKFPDCAPGEIKRVRGWLSFYEGTDIEAEFDRIAATGWNKRP